MGNYMTLKPPNLGKNLIVDTARGLTVIHDAHHICTRSPFPRLASQPRLQETNFKGAPPDLSSSFRQGGRQATETHLNQILDAHRWAVDVGVSFWGECRAAEADDLCC